MTDEKELAVISHPFLALWCFWYNLYFIKLLLQGDLFYFDRNHHCLYPNYKLIPQFLCENFNYCNNDTVVEKTVCEDVSCLYVSYCHLGIRLRGCFHLDHKFNHLTINRAALFTLIEEHTHTHTHTHVHLHTDLWNESCFWQFIWWNKTGVCWLSVLILSCHHDETLHQ